MKDLNKKIKEDFKAINLSEETKNDILNTIYTNYANYKKRNNITLSICLILFVCLIGLGVTYADEIVKYFKIYPVIYKNGEIGTYGKVQNINKVINYEADIPEFEKEGKGKEYTLSELEKLLETKIIKSKNIKSDIVTQYKTLKVNGKISSASFRYENFYDNDTTKAKLFFTFITKYDTSSQNLWWETGQARQSSEYLIKNLNTNAYILQFKGEEWTSHYYNIYFIYDNIAYESFIICYARNKEDKEKEIMNFLDSLYI
mgnify:CR=1 FL=1